MPFLQFIHISYVLDRINLSLWICLNSLYELKSLVLQLIIVAVKTERQYNRVIYDTFLNLYLAERNVSQIWTTSTQNTYLLLMSVKISAYLYSF